MSTQNRRQQQLYSTTAEWAANDLVLLAGEIGYDTTQNRFKVGNGTSRWSELSFIEGGGGGGDTDSFGTVAVSGQTSIVADQTNEVLTFVAGTNIGITTNAPTGSVTIATSGLGTAATRDTGTGATNVILGNDARLTDARTPSAHTASHKHGGSDEVATATPTTNAIPKAALGLSTLAAGWIPDLSATYAVAAKGVTNGDSHDHSGGDGAAITEGAITLADVTTNDATTGRHGFLKKLSNSASEFMDGTGNWSTPAGGSASNSFATINCPTGTDPVADSSTDTLNLTVTGSGIVIAGNSSTDTVDFSLSGIPESAMTFTDVTTNDATTGRHGFLKKLSNVATQYMDGTGSWSTPAAATTVNVNSVANLAALDDVDSTLYKTVLVRGRTTDGDGSGGIFDWNSANLQTQCTADTLQGIYVAPTSAPTGASGAWVRQRNTNEVRPEWFGTSYTHTELQAAIDMLSDGGALIVPPGTTWTISTGLLVEQDKITITCDSIYNEGLPIFKAGTTSITLLQCTGDALHVENIGFDGTTSESNNVATAYGTCTGISLDRTTVGTQGAANLDARIMNCAFGVLSKGISFVGRSVEIFDTLFVYCFEGIVGAVYNWGAPSQSTQFRGIEIKRCRFHYCGRLWVDKTDLDPAPVCISMPINNSDCDEGGIVARNIIIEDNHADMCGPFYKGTLYDTRICNNHVWLATGRFITCDSLPTASYCNLYGVCLIANNTWAGSGTIGATLGTWTEPDHFIWATAIANVTISNNQAARCTKELINIDYGWACDIKGNRLHNANISYARVGVGDHASILYGSHSDGGLVYSYISDNILSSDPVSAQIYGYHYYGIELTRGITYVHMSMNQIMPTRSGIYAYTSGYTVGHAYVDLADSLAAPYDKFGNYVFSPWAWSGKEGSTRFIGNIKVTGNAHLHNEAVVLKMATGTLTEAQLESLHTTPITVIVAPGAGKAIVVVGAQFFYDYNSAAYGVDEGDDLVLKYTDGSGATILQVDTNGFLSATSDQMRYATPTTTAEFNPVANAAVVAYLLGALTTAGNSPLKYRIEYKVIDTSW